MKLTGAHLNSVQSKLGRTGSAPITGTICANLTLEYHNGLPPPGPGLVADHDFAAQDIVALNKKIADYNQPGRRALVCKGIRAPASALRFSRKLMTVWVVRQRGHAFF